MIHGALALKRHARLLILLDMPAVSEPALPAAGLTVGTLQSSIASSFISKL